MPTTPNILRDSGVPLFFKVAPGAEGLPHPPRPRLGTAVRMVARGLSVMQKEALVVSSRTGLTWRLSSDEGAYLDGHDEAPPPLAFVSVALSASCLSEVEELARQRGSVLDGVTLVTDIWYSMAGSTTRGTMVGRPEDIRIEAIAPSERARATLATYLADAVTASTINALFRGALVNGFTLSHNGVALEGLGVETLPGPALPDPLPAFAHAAPAPGAWRELLVNTGQTSPRYPESHGLGPDWLTDGKARMVRLRAIATRRPDGLCEVEHHLCNPQGTIFRFLVDETGRAPDAETFLAAGIGFCFLTQFGRYAKAMKRDIHDCRLVQDLHLSAAGATGGTGLSAEAAPLETHVHLHAPQDEGFARDALIMAEQSCYLHALCRMPMKPRLRVSRTI